MPYCAVGFCRGISHVGWARLQRFLLCKHVSLLYSIFTGRVSILHFVPRTFCRCLRSMCMNDMVSAF